MTPKSGSRSLLLLHPIEGVAFAGSDLADAQRGIEVERDPRDAILFRLHFGSCQTGEESILLDGYVEILMENLIGRVVFIAAGRAISEFCRAVESERDGLGLVH